MAPLVYLITGCTSGFGSEFVQQITARGDKVIATGRSASKLSHLKFTGAALLELDVTWSEKKLQETMDEAIKIFGHIDILINNAGYVITGALEETS